VTEFAEGGIVEGDRPDSPIYGRDYIIPKEFAQRWKEALDRLNDNGLDKANEGGVD